jgi:hypothetical protein
VNIVTEKSLKSVLAQLARELINILFEKFKMRKSYQRLIGKDLYEQFANEIVDGEIND